MTQWAKEGQWITCPNGHRICRVGMDITYTAPYQAGMFVDWQQTKQPGQNKPPPPCKVCGQHWMVTSARVHFEEGGWR